MRRFLSRRNVVGASSSAIVAALLCIAGGVVAVPLSAQRDTPRGLFRDVNTAGAALTAADAHTLRSRLVTVDVAQMTAAPRVASAADVAPTLSVNLFPDA